MCKISDKIKFCTCIDKNTDIEELDNYWIIHRFNKVKNEQFMGEPVFPTSMLDPNFEFNQNHILNRLNTGSAFDKPIVFKNNDRLEVVLKFKPDDNSFRYNFLYNNKKWVTATEDPFELMNHYDSEKEGEIKIN